MKKILAILAAAVILLFGGCTGETTTSTLGKGSIDPAVFRLEDSLFPKLSIRENHTFMLMLDASGKTYYKGTYTVEDDLLTLTTDDGLIYNFKIKRSYIEFVAENSDTFEKTNDTEITDGAKFEIMRKRELTTAANTDNA